MYNCITYMIALICLIGPCNLASAQNQPLSCAAAPGLQSFNQTSLTGQWYEVARQPSVANISCIQLNSTTLANGSGLEVNVTYSVGSNYQNVTEYGNATLVGNSSYTITFSLNNSNQPPMIVKLLEMYQTSDGVSWLAGCSYNVSNENSSFGFLLSRNQLVNSTGLNFVNNLVAQRYKNFQASNITAIRQSGCFRNSAGSLMPTISGFIAVLYFLMMAS